MDGHEHGPTTYTKSKGAKQKEEEDSNKDVRIKSKISRAPGDVMDVVKRPFGNREENRAYKDVIEAGETQTETERETELSAFLHSFICK